MAEYNGQGRYEFDGQVRYSEIDHRGTMTLPALINIFRTAVSFSPRLSVWELRG